MVRRGGARGAASVVRVRPPGGQPSAAQMLGGGSGERAPSPAGAPPAACVGGDAVRARRGAPGGGGHGARRALDVPAYSRLWGVIPVLGGARAWPLLRIGAIAVGVKMSIDMTLDCAASEPLVTESSNYDDAVRIIRRIVHIPHCDSRGVSKLLQAQTLLQHTRTDACVWDMYIPLHVCM